MVPNRLRRSFCMDKNIRIAIIGAGPAGLSAAMYLEKKGYENYVIYERSNRVGGKCYSPTFNGKRYEMGAIMGVPNYYAVHDIELFAGVSHEDGPKLFRSYKYPNGEIDYRWDTEDAMKSPAKFFFKHPKEALHLKKLQKQIKKFGEILATKYKGYDVTGHIGVAEGKYDGYAVSPEREHVSGENPNLKDLSMPFKDFCEMNGVPLVQEVWIQPFTSFGYGFFDEIPAGYVIKYLDFQTMMNFVKLNLWTWKDGTQSIYEALNEHLKHKAILNSDVSKVVRGEKVTLTVNGQEELLDNIIINAPLQIATEKNPINNPYAVSLDKWLDVTEEEKSLFSKIDYERYDTQAFQVEKDKYPDLSYYIVDNMVPEKMPHVMIYYRRWKDEVDQPIVCYSLRHHKTYNGGQELPYEGNAKIISQDMKDFDCPIRVVDGKEQILTRYQSYYFPHVYSEDYAAGWYDKVEAMQGKNNTFYAGEIMSYGDMDETVEYSHDLVERFF